MNLVQKNVEALMQDISCIVRAYGPGESMYSGGSYVYPVVTKQGVIKA